MEGFPLNQSNNEFEGKTIELLDKEELERIYNRSTFVFFGMPQTNELMSERGCGSGQKFLLDKRATQSRDINTSSRLSNLQSDVLNFMGIRGGLEQLRNENINRAVSCQSLMRKEKVYEEVEEGLIFKKKIKKDTGRYTIHPRKMKDFLDVEEVNEVSAYLITYYIGGTSENEFVDETTARSGRAAYFSLVIGEHDATDLYEKISNNPDILNQVFERMDSQLMSDQKHGMIDDGGKIFIKPLQDDPYVFRENRLVKIKDEYIKDLTAN